MSDPHVQSLLAKLDRWLLQQPEYPLLFLGDRKTRRQAATLLGKHIFTLPERDVPVPVNRTNRRKLVRVLKAEVRKPPTPSKRARKDEALARRMHTRHMALQGKRDADLLAQLVEEGVIDDPALD